MFPPQLLPALGKVFSGTADGTKGQPNSGNHIPYLCEWLQVSDRGSAVAPGGPWIKYAR
jgi:hypothetical protein